MIEQKKSAAQPGTGEDRPMTVAEFERLPEEDAYTFELVRGHVVRSPRPASLHGVLVARLCHRLNEFVKAHGRGVVLAESGVILARDPDTVRGPDVSFYTTERIPDSAYATTFWGPPDLAIEITSPANRASTIEEKVADYLEAGVRLVWVFDPPTRTVAVHRAGFPVRVLEAGAVVEGDDVLPGFRLPLAAFFAL